MLASKKQDWVSSREYTPQLNEKRRPNRELGVNNELRKKCCAFVVLLMVIAGIATLQSERIISSGYHCVKLQAELRDVEQRNEQLRVEIAKLRSLDRIQTIATTDLGMTTPKAIYEIPMPSSAVVQLAASENHRSPQRKL